MRKHLLIILLLAFVLPFAVYAQDEDPIEIDWNTRADALEGETGDVFFVTCPEDGATSSIWGTEIYTSDSSVCTAAAHMGLITLEDGGEFLVTMLDGQDEYEGTEQNDITTSNWGSFRASFSVSTLSDAIPIEWSTSADEFEGETDDTFVVACPEDGDAGSLWGTEIYTDDSSVCTAAVHMGLITLEDGGEFLVTILDGQDEYEGSEENDIESRDWGRYGASFSVSSTIIAIEWTTRAYELEGEVDDTFAVACPEDGAASSLWGTEIYTSDSSICTAAVHMDLISLEDGGEVLVTILEGQDEYEGSEENDIESRDWGSYGGSFSVAPNK